MEIKLQFRITLADGTETSQEITAPADPQYPIDQQTQLLMMQMLKQYASVGLLRNPEKNKFILICPSRLATVECELPSILLAGANEVPKPAIIE
jgi:hypothetical protein